MRFCKNEYSKKYLLIQKRNILLPLVSSAENHRYVQSHSTLRRHTHTWHMHTWYTQLHLERTSQRKPRESSPYLVRTARCVKSLHMYIHICLRIYYHWIASLLFVAIRRDRLLSTRISYRPACPDILRSPCVPARGPPSPLIVVAAAVVS